MLQEIQIEEAGVSCHQVHAAPHFILDPNSVDPVLTLKGLNQVYQFCLRMWNICTKGLKYMPQFNLLIQTLLKRTLDINCSECVYVFYSGGAGESGGDPNTVNPVLTIKGLNQTY